MGFRARAHALEMELEEVAARLFPAAGALRAEVRPLADLSLGTFGSGIALAVASRLREDPQTVAARLVEALPHETSRRCSAMRGFINIEVPWEEGLPLEAELPSLAGETSIVLAPRPRGCTPGSFARLASRVALHALLARMAGMTARAYLPRAEGEPVVIDPGDPLLLSTFSRSAECSGEDATRMVEEEAGRATHLWLAPATVPRRAYTRLFENGQSRCRTHPVTREWLGEIAIPVPSGGELPDDGLAMLFYLGSDIPAHDLDLFIPTSRESASIWWFLVSSRQRADQLAASIRSGEPSGTASAFPDLVREIWARASLLGEFHRRAVLEGDVGEWVTALTALLRAFRRLCNEPSFRQRLARGAESRSERDILYGVARLFGDIIGRVSPI